MTFFVVDSTAEIEIEKENKPQQNGDSKTEMEVEPAAEPEPPTTPKVTKTMATPKSGRKRTREEIEATKAEKEKK